MQQRLVEANAKKSDAPLAEVLGLLSTLSEAWASVVEAHQSTRSNVTFLQPSSPSSPPSEVPGERLALIA
jgi:hypothetical protein